MMYMPDAIRATIELMEADASKIAVRYRFIPGRHELFP